MGTSFTFLVPISNFLILTCYPTHIRQRCEIEYHFCPWLVWVSPHQIIFLVKKKIFQRQGECCNVLSSNMLTLTFLWSNNLVAPLNFNSRFILWQISMGNKIIFYIRDGFGWVHISSLPITYPCFEIGENSSSYPNSIKAEKTRQIMVGSDG